MNFISFMRLYGLRKCFKFGVIRCLTEEVIDRKPQTSNFHQNFRGPRAQKLWVRSEKIWVAKMGRTSSMRVQSSVEIGGRTTAGDKKQWCSLYVCLSHWRA